MTHHLRLLLVASCWTAFVASSSLALPAATGEDVRGGWEVGFSSALRPSVGWSYHSTGHIGYCFGAAMSALIVPFPLDMSFSGAEESTSYFVFYPEVSGFAGVRASIGEVVDFRLDLDFGGDLYLQWGGLSIPAYSVDAKAVAVAVTPRIWFRPSIRFNPGALFQTAWLKRFSVETSVVLTPLDPLVLTGWFRWEVSLLWRP